MMLNFSANLSMLFCEVPLIERFALAKAAGFTAIEIQFPYELTIAQIRTELSKHSLSLVLINMPAGDLMTGGDGLFTKAHIQSERLSAINQACEYASALNVPTVNILIGRVPLQQDRASVTPHVITNVRYAAQQLFARGITPVVEAINGIDMPHFYLQTIEQQITFLTEVNYAPLALQVDVYHLARMSTPILPALECYMPVIKHIQFADFPGRHEPGTGELDFKSLFTWLQNSPYSGYCGAEYKPSKPTLQTFQWLTFPSNTVLKKPL